MYNVLEDAFSFLFGFNTNSKVILEIVVGNSSNKQEFDVFQRIAVFPD